MQNIELVLRNEIGETVERSNINFAHVMKLAFEIKNLEIQYPLLSGVDPYGMTYFNFHQSERLIKELMRFKMEIGDGAIDELQEAIDFIGRAKQHRFINFIGD